MIFFIPEQEERMKIFQLFHFPNRQTKMPPPPFSKFIDNLSSPILFSGTCISFFLQPQPQQPHYSLQAIRRCSFSFFLKVKALLPHSLTINHLQMTFGVIFIRFMIIMRDISKAICGIVQNIVPILKKMSRKLYCTTNLNQMGKT